MELAQHTTTPRGTEVWQVRGPWWALIVATSFLDQPLALGGGQARGGEPPAQSAVACSVRTRHLLDLERLGLILEGATPAPGEALQGEPGAPAGVASGAGSQLHSLPGAGVAPHLAWEGGVGYRPTALPRAHRKLKDNVEQSYNCCNRHCGWKSFLTAPDSLWEG